MIETPPGQVISWTCFYEMVSVVQSKRFPMTSSPFPDHATFLELYSNRLSREIQVSTNILGSGLLWPTNWQTFLPLKKISPYPPFYFYFLQNHHNHAFQLFSFGDTAMLPQPLYAVLHIQLCICQTISIIICGVVTGIRGSEPSFVIWLYWLYTGLLIWARMCIRWSLRSPY